MKIRDFIDFMCATTVVAASDEFDFLETGRGRFRISGVLNVATASNALDTGKRLFAEQRNVELDLGGVTTADSAGLALLLEWAAWGTAQGVSIRYSSIPHQILCLAKIGEADRLLPQLEASNDARAGT